MDQSSTRLSELFKRYSSGTYTDAERRELMQNIADEANEEQMHQLIDDVYDHESMDYVMTTVRSNELYANIITRATTQQSETTPVTPMQQSRFLYKQRWIAAALLILAIGSGVYYFNNQSSKLPANIGGTGGTVGTRGDVAPGKNRAILTINDNQKIDLATNKTGININNTITYNDGEKIADAGQLLQLTTPRGGQYQAVLPDGSKVWLNAASSIKFPSKFNSEERKVEVTGEAYFEIAKDAARPFKVSGGGQEIDVLGTSFNINVYDDEPTKKITLVTGSIKITSNKQTAILKPGQQASISILEIPKIRLIPVQTTNITSWKDGYFIFTDASIHEIMRQLARWYDLEITYKGDITTGFFTKISRNAPVSEALAALERTNVVHFKQEGNKITVLP